MRSRLIALVLLALPAAALADEIGEVTTAWKLLGANHRIVVEAFDDPKVAGVFRFVSRARTGGISGSLGLAEDTSDVSIACRQTGPIEVIEAFEPGEEVFSQRSSLLFKRVQVVRFYDDARNALIYLTYSDKLFDGSPKNAISAVVVAPWVEAPALQMPE